MQRICPPCSEKIRGNLPDPFLSSNFFLLLFWPCRYIKDGMHRQACNNAQWFSIFAMLLQVSWGYHARSSPTTFVMHLSTTEEACKIPLRNVKGDTIDYALMSPKDLFPLCHLQWQLLQKETRLSKRCLHGSTICVNEGIGQAKMTHTLCLWSWGAILKAIKSFQSGIDGAPHIQHWGGLKHLHNVETHFYCPQAFLSLDFQFRDDVSEL